jgi:hypothetical protein
LSLNILPVILGLLLLFTSIIGQCVDWVYCLRKKLIRFTHDGIDSVYLVVVQRLLQSKQLVGLSTFSFKDFAVLCLQWLLLTVVIALMNDHVFGNLVSL